MKKAMSIFLALILAQVASIALGAQSRSGVVTLTVDLSAHASGQDSRLWLPYPVTAKPPLSATAHGRTAKEALPQEAAG